MCHNGGARAPLSPARGGEGPEDFYQLSGSTAVPMSQPWLHGCRREEEKVMGENSSKCANALGKEAKKTEPGSFPQCLVQDQEQWTHIKTQEVPSNNEEEHFYYEGNQALRFYFVITVSNTSAL